MDVNMVLVQPVQAFLSQLLGFLPSLLGALLILLLGWIAAKVIEGVVVQLLKGIRLDKLAEKIQLADVLTKGNIKRKLSELIGAIIYWLITLVVWIAALNALQLTVAAHLLEQVVTFLPNVVAAIFILIVGAFSATFLAATIRTAAGNVGMGQSQLLSQVVQTVVISFAAVAALQQLQIQLVGQTFLIILSAVAFGLALAFGLGCKDLAGRWVGDLIDQVSKRR